MTTYIGIGVIISLGLFVIQSHRESYTAVFSAIIISVIAITIALILLPVRKSLGVEIWYQKEPYCWVLVYFVMLLGMFFSVLTKAIDDRKIKLAKCVKDEDKKNIKLYIDYFDILYPFLISFLTFGSLYSQLENKQIALTSFILSFQTGFFWETVINTIKKKY